jgi:hypothetical protein
MFMYARYLSLESHVFGGMDEFVELGDRGVKGQYSFTDAFEGVRVRLTSWLYTWNGYKLA